MPKGRKKVPTLSRAVSRESNEETQQPRPKAPVDKLKQEDLDKLLSEDAEKFLNQNRQKGGQ
jgi:hypothetical protein